MALPRDARSAKRGIVAKIDLGYTLNGHYALCFRIHAFSEPITKI